MGLMTELFIASTEDAADYGEREGEGFERTQLGDLTNLEFETLWAILEHDEWDDRYCLSEVASTEGTATFRFPDPYLTKLQALEAAGIYEAATKWAATDEMACQPHEAAAVIEALVKIAKSAATRNQGLFVWVSL